MMIFTVIIVALMLVVFIFILKGQNFQGNLFNYLIMFFVGFFLITLFYVYINNSVDLSNFNGFMEFGNLYFSWLGHLGGNFMRISGYAVNQDWSLNATNSTGG